jgi:hypothetical protein
MTDKQIELADHLIKMLVDNKGILTSDDYYSDLMENNYDQQDIRLVILELKDIGILGDIGISDNQLRLTHEGYKVAKLGYQKYFLDLDQEVNMMKDKIRNETKLITWKVKAFWPLVVVTVLSLLIALLSYLKH